MTPCNTRAPRDMNGTPTPRTDRTHPHVTQTLHDVKGHPMTLRRAAAALLIVVGWW